MANGDTTAIPWYRSPRIREALYAFLPTLLLILKNRFRLDLTGYVDTIVEVILGMLSLYGGIKSIARRVQDGNDPGRPEPPIEQPAIVTAVSRLTK